MTLGRQAVSSVAWASLSAYVRFALSFVGNVLLARLLLPDDFGQFALASAIAEILFVVTAWNLPQGMIQLQNEPDVGDTAYVLSIFVAIGTVGIAVGISAGLLLFYPTKVVLVLVALCAVRACGVVSDVYAAHLERELRYKAFSIVRLLASNGSMVFGLALALIGWGVWSLVGRELIYFSLFLFGCGWASRWRFARRFNRATARRLVDFGFKTLLARGLESLYFRGDGLLVGSLAGTISLGYYDRARYVSESGHFTVNQGAVQVAFPLYSRLQGDCERLSWVSYQMQFVVARIMGLFALMLVLMPEQIVGFLYGQRWLPAAEVLRWLAVYAFLSPVVDNAKVLLTATGLLWEAVKIRFWQLGVAIPGIVLGFVWFGVNGVAFGMSLGMFAGFLSSQYYARASVRVPISGVYVPPLICMSVTAGVWYGIRLMLPVLSAYGLILLPFLYVACLVAVNRNEILQLVRLLTYYLRTQPTQLDGKAQVNICN